MYFGSRKTSDLAYRHTRKLLFLDAADTPGGNRMTGHTTYVIEIPAIATKYVAQITSGPLWWCTVGENPSLRIILL